MQVLKDNIFKISPNLNIQKLQELRERLEELFKTYEEPEFDNEGKLIPKRKAPRVNQENGDNIDAIDFDINEAEMDDLRKELDLNEGTLVTNLFIPTTILCSKVDMIAHGEKSIKDLLFKNLDYI